MNKIYKVIWSKVRNAYVVVSELAKNHGKEKSEVNTSHGSRLGAALLLSLLLGGSLVAGGVPAEAAAVNAGTTGNSSTSARNNNTLAVGDNTTALGAGALAVGGGTKADGLRAIAIAGGQAKSDYTISIGENSVAGGGYSYTQAGSATNTLSGIATKAIAIGSSTSALGVDDVVIGANQTANTPNSAYYETANGYDYHIAVGGRVMVGHDNTATGRAANSVIVGSNNSSNSVHGIAIGQNAQVGQAAGTVGTKQNGERVSMEYENTMAIGTNTRAYATSAIAIGNNAVAGNNRTTNINYDWNGQGAVAIGEKAQSTAYYTVALGSESNANGGFAIAVGKKASATSANTLATGFNAQATATGTIASGASAAASAENAIATGLQAAASGRNSAALGANSTASSSGGVALGSSSTSTRSAASNSSGWSGQDSTWSSWVDTKDTSLSTGSGVWNSTQGAVSIGTDGADGSTITRQLTGVAAGTKDTDAVNMAQWKNTVLATVGDDKSDSLTKTYGTDGAARNVTRVLNESLTITGAGDTARTDATNSTTKTLKKAELTSQANIGTVVSDNQIAIRLARNLQGLETASLSNSTSGNSTKVSGDGITITPASGSTVSLTRNGLDNGGNQITGVASGGDTGTNGANIDDVTRISQKNIQVKGGSNITVTDSTADGVRTSSVALNNNVDLSADGSLAFGSTTDNTYVDKTGVTTHVANTDGTRVDATLSGSGLHVIGKAADGSTSNQVVTDETGMVVGYETGDKANTLFDTAVGSGKQKTSLSTKGVKVEGTTNLDTNGQTAATSRKINTTLSEEGVNINQSQTLLQERGLTVGKDGEKTTAGQATVYRTGLNVVGSAVNDTADKTATVTAGGLTANGDATGDKIATVTAEGLTVQADADKDRTATYNVSGVTLSDKTSGTKTNTVSVDGMTLQNGTSGAALTTTNLQLGMTNGTGGINLGNQAGGGANTAEGNYLTGLSNTAWDAKNIASGRAATEDQLKAVSDSISAAAKPTLVTVEGGTAAGTTDYAGNNLKLKATTTDGQTTYDLKLADKVSLGSGKQAVTLDGTSGKITAGTDTTRQVVFDGVAATARVGADISLDGAAGKAHIGGTTIGRLSAGELTYKDKDGNIVTGTTVPAGSYATGLSNASWNVENPNYVTGRAATEDELVTVSKAVTTKTFGLTDDNGTAVTRTLDHTIQVKGGISDTSKLTADDNIGVVADGTDALKVRLAKDLKGLDSVTTGNTVVNNDGITITNNGNTVSLTDSGLNNGGNKITNVANGTDANDAVNYSQLNEVKTLAGKHTKVTAEGQAPTDTNYVGGNLKVNVTDNDGQATYDVKLADTVTLGTGSKQVVLDGNNGQVTAGNIVMGQHAADTLTVLNKANADSGTKAAAGNYVTGLDNKEWNVTNPTYVSGRAATEDQLKKVTDSISSEVASKSDYQLVANPAGGNYKVTEGKVELTVKDAAHEDAAVNTVTIEGIASQTDLADKTFGLTADDSNSVTNTLDNTVKVKGDDKTISTSIDGDGLKISLKDDITIGGKDGANGTNGHIGVDGKDGKDGADGYNGKDAVSIDGKDGNEGHIGLNGKDGKDGERGADGKNAYSDISTHFGPASLNDAVNVTMADGTTKMTRLKYEDQNGNTHEVATMDDGQVYGGDTGTAFKRYLNQQANVKGGITEESKLTTEDNIGVVSDGTDTLKVRLAKDLKGLDSVTTGNTVVNNDGITINNKVSLTDGGLNNGGNKITNVANGTDASDAVNYSQLSEVKTLAGKHTKVTVEGGTEAGTTDYAGSSLKLKATTTDGQTTYDLKLGDNLSIGGKDGADGKDGHIGVNGVDGKSGVGIDGKDGISIKGADGKDGVTISGKDGVDGMEGHIGLNGKDGMTDIWTKPGEPGLNGKDGETLTRIVYKDPQGQEHQGATLDDGLKFGGDFGDASAVKLNKQVNVKGNAKNEADLTDGNIGVVSSQAGDNGQLLIKLNKDLDLTDQGSVKLGNVSLSGSGLDNGGKQITDVASGTTGKSWDATTQGYEATWNNAANIGDVQTAISDIKGADKGGFGLTADDGQSVKQDLGKTITVAGDGKNIGTKVTDGKLEVALKKDVDLGTDGSVKAGETTISKDGVETNKITIKDSSISLSKDGIDAGNTVIKDVHSGIVKGDATDNTNAANIGDVKQIAGSAAESVKAKSGKNITVKDDNTVNLNDQITLGDDKNKAQQVSIDGQGATVTAGDGDNQVKLDGSKGRITAGGATLGNQENSSGDKNPVSGSYLTGLDNKTWDGSHIQSGRAATEDQLKVVDDKISGGRVFQGDDGKDNAVTVGLGNTMKLTGGADPANLVSGNIGVVKNSNGDGLEIKLAKDITGLDSVTTGNTTINSSGVTIKSSDSTKGGDIKLATGEVSMGGSQIHDVAPGSKGTDAVNVDQLSSAMGNVERNFSKLDARVNRAGANAAALAALHPLDFDSDDKLDVAAGTGHYNGANAVAIGAFYRPNEDTMISLGGSMGGGENMINAGVTFKLGQHNHVSNTRVAMAKEIKALKALVDQQNGEMQQMKQLMNQLAGKTALSVDTSALFPDIPQNHWAYEYVTKLAHTGIVEGYPDGEFKGNRMMTRYEFATMLYRAIMNGAAANPDLNKNGTLDKLTKEFEPELKYIRIDTIARDSQGKPTIERVRVIKQK